MTDSIKKVLLGVALFVGIGGYVYWSGAQSSSASVTTTVAAANDTGTTQSATVSDAANNSTPNATVSTSNTITNNTTATGAYKNGSYTGAIANSIYGNVQVSATITGGKLTAITFLAYPKNEDNSVEISNRAMPILKREAIASQSANVDAISGATQTREAFEQTLQSVLTQAKT